AVGGLVGLDRDGAADPALAQQGPVGLAAVGVGRQHSVGAGARPAACGSGHPDASQHGGELWTVATLAAGQYQGQRLAALLTGQMQLGGPATPRPAQRVIVRLVTTYPARRFELQFRPLPGTGGVLMGTGDGRVNAHVPRDQTQHISPALQPGQDPRPGAITLPASVQPVHRAPMPVAVRHVTPGRPGPYPPPDPIDQLPLAPLRRPTRLLTLGQQRLQHRPLPVGQVEPPRHRYPGHEVSVLMDVLVDNPSTGDLATYRSPTRRRQITTPLLKQGLGVAFGVELRDQARVLAARRAPRSRVSAGATLLVHPRQQPGDFPGRDPY